jgi:hypothetical protein
MIALVASFVLVAPGLWWLNRYYAATFGRQVRHVRKAGLLTRLFLPAFIVVAILLNALFPAIPAGAPTAATVAIAAVWVAFRDWPWRAYYLVVPVAVAIAFNFTASGGGIIDPQQTLAVLFLTVGASFVPIGTLDHMLLVKLMNEARVPEATTVANRST